MTLETGAEKLRESSCTVTGAKTLWKAIPLKLLRLISGTCPTTEKESCYKAALETSSSLCKQWPFDKQCEKKTTTTTNNKQLLARNVTKWPSYYNWPNLSPALRWVLYWQAFSRSLLCINKYSYLKKRGHRNSEFYLLLQLINRVSNCLHIRCPILLLNYVFHPFVKCIVHLTMQKNPNLDWCIYSTILHHTFEPLVLLVSSIREPQTT